MLYTRFLSIFLALSLIFSPISLYANPFTQMSIEDEYELGEQFNLAMKTSAPIIYDPIVKDYLQDILESLIIYVENKDYDYEVNLLLDSSLNAFAAPGGYIFFNSGLFLKLENESELASIMAHEIAHVSQRHLSKRYAKSAKISVATMLASLASIFAGSADVTGAVLAGSTAAGQSALLNYSRNDENEADAVGFEYTVKAGYDPMGYVTSFAKLQNQVGYDGSYPVYLSTHPDLDDRISKMASRIRSQNPNYIQKNIDNTNFLFVQKFIRANYEDVKTARTILSKEDKNKADTKLALATLAMREYKLEEAKSLFTSLEKDLNSNAFKKEYNNDKKAFFMREIAHYHYKFGEIQDAKKLLDASLALNNKDLMTHFHLGRTLDNLQNTNKSIEHYKIILDTYPYDSQVHNLIGQAYGKEEKYFLGYLHLAYGNLYSGKYNQAENMIKNAREYAKSEYEKDLIKNFNKDSKEFKKIFAS